MCNYFYQIQTSPTLSSRSRHLLFIFSSSAAAAVHILCEWGILLSVATDYKDKEFKKTMSLAAFAITFLVTLCICVPSLNLSLALAQAFGIMLDFGMPLMFSLQLIDREKRQIYRLPAIAHTG